MSLVLDGKKVDLPGFETKSYFYDPTVPRTTDGNHRRFSDVKGGVVHTVTGRPFNPKVIQGSRPSEHAERLARYQAYSEREVSWHYTVDTDGTIVQSADPARWACWHAGGVNPWTIGIELCQDPSGNLYSVQISAFVALATHLCDTFQIKKRVPVRTRTGRPHGGLIPRLQGRAAPWSGFFGHRNQTSERGHGDPGDAPFDALLLAGYAPALFP